MICKRCGREYDNPVPEVTHSEGLREIACEEWCAGCNAFTMSIAFRESSAYRLSRGELRNPLRVRGDDHVNT